MNLQMDKLQNGDRPGLKQILFNQVLFCLSYWFVLVCVAYSMRECLFDEEFLRHKKAIMILADIAYVTCVSVFIGLTPFLISAVWCNDNPLYQKMMRNSFLIKFTGRILLLEFALFLIDLASPAEVGRTRFFLSLLNSVLIPLFFIVAYYVRNYTSIKPFVRRRGEKHADWETRVGYEVVRNIAYTRISTVSVCVTFVLLLAMLSIGG